MEKENIVKPKLNVVLTGFGPFMSVTNNPSDSLVKMLAEGFNTRFKSKNIVLFHNETVSVDQTSVDTCIAKIKQKVLNNKQKNAQDKYLMLHFGKNFLKKIRCEWRNCPKENPFRETMRE